jgi:hypothetical protein
VTTPGVGSCPDPALKPTPDEAAVIQLVRQTPYGEVVTTMRDGQIIRIRREETFVPPSLQQRSSPVDGQS